MDQGDLQRQRHLLGIGVMLHHPHDAIMFRRSTLEEPKLGYRDPEHEALYKQFVRDPHIQMDMVSPSIEGYFRIPAVWIGKVPEPTSVLELNPQIHHEVVFTTVLACGIEVWVQRDGHFLFDFSKWPPAPQIVIPGYTRPNGNAPHRVPRFHTEAEDKAEDYAVLRAQVMNAHQACLTAAERHIKQRSTAMGFPVTAWSTEKAITVQTCHSYHDDTEDIHALARNVLNNSMGVKRDQPLSRRLIEIEVIDYSMFLLDKILSDRNSQAIQLVESFYMAACRAREKRFGESITLGWSVCEQLISILWKQFIDERKAISADHMNKERKEKLTGRDFTTSIVIETLELTGRIDHQLFRLLNIARQSRNNWTHRLQPPKERQVFICIRAVEQLFSKVTGLDLPLQFSGRGGVPQWPAYMAEQAKTGKR